MSTRRDVSGDAEFKKWFESQDKKHYSESKWNEIDAEVGNAVKNELSFLKNLHVQHYALAHKQHELQSWLPDQTTKDIEWVKHLIWRPIGKSDYRRIQPELIQVKSEFAINSFNPLMYCPWFGL